jgi:hypothetical protein
MLEVFSVTINVPWFTLRKFCYNHTQFFNNHIQFRMTNASLEISVIWKAKKFARQPCCYFTHHIFSCYLRSIGSNRTQNIHVRPSHVNRAYGYINGPTTDWNRVWTHSFIIRTGFLYFHIVIPEPGSFCKRVCGLFQQWRSDHVKCHSLTNACHLQLPTNTAVSRLYLERPLVLPSTVWYAVQIFPRILHAKFSSALNT